MADFMQELSFRLDCQQAEFMERMEGRSEGTLSYARNPTHDYLKMKGYVNSMYKGLNVWMKGFVCVVANDDNIVVWHDVDNPSKQVINKSILTHLPIVLRYMEKINN